MNPSQIEPIELTWDCLWRHIWCHHSMAFSFFTYSLLFCMGLSSWHVSKYYATKINRNITTGNISNGLRNYEEVKQLSLSISRVFGVPILFYHFITIAFMAKLPDLTFWPNVQNLSVTGFLLMAPVIWLSFAEFHAKVRQGTINWLFNIQRKNGYSISADAKITLMDIRNDCLLDPVGISCKFFTVTYGVLGSVH